jgi:hypothetical protein
MNYLKQLVIYSWKYLLLSITLFVIFWQCYSVYQNLNFLENKLESASMRYGQEIQKAYSNLDLFSLKNSLGKIKEKEINTIRFLPRTPHPFFKKILIGEIDAGKSFWNYRNVFDLFVDGAYLGSIHYSINLWDLNKLTFYKNFPLFVTTTLFLIFLLAISNFGTIKTLLNFDKSLSEVSLLTEEKLSISSLNICIGISKFIIRVNKYGEERMVVIKNAIQDGRRV